MINSEEDSQKLADLETILDQAVPDSELRQTVLDIYRALQGVRKAYYDPSEPEKYAKRHGMLVITNYDPKHSKLTVNGWNTAKSLEGFSIRDEAGKDKLNELIDQDGAVVVRNNGEMENYHRHIENVDTTAVAVKKKIIKKGETIYTKLLGFDEDARRELSGDPEYESVCTKHNTVMGASGIDPRAYFFVLSQDTGTIIIVKDYKILYSDITSEIHPSFHRYLARTEPTSPQINHASTAPSYAQGMHTPHALIGEDLALSFKIRLDAMKELHSNSRYAHY